jgi:energy-coupling factor transport system substrate-specific component
MSWQLASFLLLGSALAGGFAWYERSHPSARVLALVGTLAALAVLGRIAFAPVPNVKPTSDLVLLSGYVFGGAPGFAVGAVAALASNFFFTQGPWTPWQMAAWGGVGIAGAGLARLGRGRLGRLPLALACGLAGFAYGAVVNFGSVATFGGGDLGRRFLAYEATSLPWDAAHAAGNVAFFLLFGPALVRTLRRFRTRLEFTWQPSSRAAGAALALAALLLAGAGAAAPPARAAAPSPVSYLLRAQNADGGFGAAPGRPSAALYTGWTALGLAAEGRKLLTVRRAGHSVIDWVAAHAGGLTRNGSATGVGDLERTILVVRAAGRNPRAFAHQDLVAALSRQVGHDGSVLQQVNLTAFAIFALRAGGVRASTPALRRAGAWLARRQNADGGFGFLGGIASDVDDSGAAMQALAALGGRRSALRRAVGYLRQAQNPDGGLPQSRGGESNAQSTAWAIQGLVAAGVRHGTIHRKRSRSPVAYLRSLIEPDGSVRYSSTIVQTPVWVTASAALGLAGRPLPLRPVGAARSASFHPPGR